jgi:hypothetical protein
MDDERCRSHSGKPVVRHPLSVIFYLRRARVCAAFFAAADRRAPPLVRDALRADAERCAVVR